MLTKSHDPPSTQGEAAAVAASFRAEMGVTYDRYAAQCHRWTLSA